MQSQNFRMRLQASSFTPILPFAGFRQTEPASSLYQGCALVAVRACLLVLLCYVHLNKILSPYLPYPVHPTVVPSVRYTCSILFRI
jgi:hypothetical protein